MHDHSTELTAALKEPHINLHAALAELPDGGYAVDISMNGRPETRLPVASAEEAQFWVSCAQYVWRDIWSDAAKAPTQSFGEPATLQDIEINIDDDILKETEDRFEKFLVHVESSGLDLGLLSDKKTCWKIFIEILLSRILYPLEASKTEK